jgi:heptosyltransferase-2
MERDPSQGADRPKTVLVIRLGSLGDVLLTTPVLRELGIAFPHAELHYLTRRRYADLLSHHPSVRQLHLLPDGAGVRALLKTGLRLRRLQFDLVVDLHGSFRSRVVRSALGAGAEIVYEGLRSSERAGTPETPHLVEWPSLAERFLQTLAPFGVQPQAERLEIHLDQEAARKAEALVCGMDPPLVALAPGSRWAIKRWPAEGFAEVADALSSENHASIILLGDTADAPICDRVASRMAASAHCFCGKLSILETAAVLERCHLLVCNDSGLFHVARAAGTPSIAVFGPTGPQMGYYPWEPYARALSLQMPCSPCTRRGRRRCPKRHFRCMRNLSPDTVLRAANELWDLG